MSIEKQMRLLEFFELEVTARSAADLLSIQPNTAALFYRKLRQVIVQQLEQDAHEQFDGAVELDESYFGGVHKKVAPDSIVYTDSYRSYNALDVATFHHHRINHSLGFACGKNHTNGIENFWNQAKRVLRKYNGIPKASFALFLKQCEFRFNYGSPKQQLATLKNWVSL